MGNRAVMGARLASIVIAGLWMGLTTPVQAGRICAGSGCATSASATGESAQETAVSKPVTLSRYAKRAAKKSALRTRVAANRNARASKIAQYSRVAARVKKAGKKFVVASAKPASPEPASLKPSLANARAEMSETDAGVANDTPITVETKEPDANIQLAAADQVNDIDRAAENEVKPPPPAAKPPSKPSSQTVMTSPQDARAAVASNDSTWDQTSFIGKLFVAFGGLLTLASAARLFIA